MDAQEQGPQKELAAMMAVADALKDLEREAVSRVLRWAAGAFGAGAVTGSTKDSVVQRSAEVKAEVSPSSFGSVADIYHAAAPTAEPDKALVVGYWIQVVQAEAEFDSQAVNKMLKDLGYGVRNITQALSSLMSRKPQLVIQTRKSGTSQQARKRYKLTTAGINAVEKMLGKESGESNHE